MTIPNDSPMRKAEILAALSRALDLVEGQPQGHSARTCLIATQIAQLLDLEDSDIDAIYIGALLKDAGCSNNSARIHKLFGGDDFLIKGRVKLVDWSNPIDSLKFAMAHTEHGQGVVTKLRRMLGNINTPARVMDEVTTARCTRGAMIAKMLGFDEHVQAAVRDLDEHWDGKGSPTHKRGNEIPLHARVVCLAQTLEVFVTTFDVETAFDMMEKRRGKWFDPELVDVCRALKDNQILWAMHSRHTLANTTELPVGAAHDVALDKDVDTICEAFAMIIDAKSSFTAEHSTRVTKYALELADHFGLNAAQATFVKRASLLHDIGKLGVSNSILEKPGKPTDEEFATIKLHPKFTHEILQEVRGFERVTEIASAHHERLDGKGYWRGLDASQLDLEMRIVSAADVFDALTAERPYREALPLSKVFEIMDKEAGSALDPTCIDGFKQRYGVIDATLTEKLAA
jgi:putative nucleotidyltransferase with HDIG domain